MQSFRERCGFHGNQQNYQPSSQDSSRLENYRHQSHPGLNCVRQRQMTKGYYAQTSYQGYENNTGEKYPRGDKHMNVQQLQGTVSFATFPEGNVYPGQYTGEDGMQNWGQSQALSGAKYEENVIKKSPGESSGYQDPTGQIPFRSHSLHHPQQPNLPYTKLPQQKVQNDVPSSPLPFSQSSHFNQNFPTSTYSSVPGNSPVSHSFKSCTAPSNPPHERAMATAGQLVQSLHGYQSSRMASFEQTQRHHAQETLHYQNMAKYHGQHYSQQGQAYCQPETPSRTPEQYYQTFSPSASHSPARSVGRSPSYSSTPSPLMPNIENFQYNQQQHNANTFPMGISDHSHYMPLLNPSPTGTSSPESQTKSLQNDKIPETLLSDLSLQSLTALTSQVENISTTVQQLLMTKSGIPQKKAMKTSPRTPEQMKGQHCSSESSAYSSEPMGTPLSETLGTPQSVHAEVQDTDYLSGSDDQLEKNYLYCGPGRSPARANSTKMKPESISTCSVTSPDNMSTKSDDSFQSIHANLPLETFAKLVSSESECPHLLVNALSQEELSTEIIALQDAIDNEKAEKAWVDSPELDNNSPKSPFNLENHTCVQSVVKNTWSDQENVQIFSEALKKGAPEKNSLRNHDEFNEDYYEKKEFQSPNEKVVEENTKNSEGLGTEKNMEPVTSSASYTSYSNTVANTNHARNSDPFDWPDKNMTESCLRWKEIELSLHSSDLQKGLFQSKEIKVDSQPDVPDVETPLENDSGEDFNKEGAEEMAYQEDSKEDNEKWLEDTRDCYTEEDFQDIPDLPSQKESNLEPEDYSSLCDFSERKSFIYDESITKPARGSEALSSIESIENPSAEEKENLVESSHLSCNSIMLLGPAVETESKVKSWFESTIPHIDDTKEKVEEDTEDGVLESGAIQEAEEKITETIHNQPPPKTEEVIEKKSLRGRRSQCKIAESSVLSAPVQTLTDLNSKSEAEEHRGQMESVSEVPAINKTSVTKVTPARMCTRSFTAKVEPQGCGTGIKTPPQEKMTRKGAFGEKERAPYKTGRRVGKNALKMAPTPNDENVFLLQNNSPAILDSTQKSKENGFSILRGERSMILRSRSKKQELFPPKRKRGKKGMNFVLKKRSSLKKIIANNCSAVDTFQMMPKVRKRMKLSDTAVGINVKNSERPLHSLKRKSSLISPVPAKKRNLIIRGKKTKEPKSEAPPKLLKKIKPIKKEKVKLAIASKKNCKVILSAPSVRMTQDVCLKVTSRASYHGLMKTKVLPPRKGRGLKLEAIVQKMTSPNQKKQGAAMARTAHALAINSRRVTQGREIKELKILGAGANTKAMVRDLSRIESSKLKHEQHNGNCQGSGNKTPLKGKPLYKKKGASNSLHGEAGLRNLAKREGNCLGSKKPSSIPKKKFRRGRAKSSPITSKVTAKKMLGSTPPVLLTSKTKALSDSVLLTNKFRSSDCKQVRPKVISNLPETSEEVLSQTGARKKSKYPAFNGYTKRQRKCSPRSKPTRQAAGTRRRSKRQNIPLVTPKEPEIKLKYVSSKPARAESRVRLFSPYIQVEKKNAFTTTCTIINSAGDEMRLLKERSAVHSSSPVTFSSQGSVPISSRMQLGPLICKSVSSGCLLCCLCRCPANYKDLGDLCGPYYPMDCLPNKKPRPKEKLKPEDTLTEKPSKMVDSVCTAGSGRTSCTNSGATDLVKHNNLRSSTRAALRKLPSCYCCNKKAEGTEAEKPRRHHCTKSSESHSLEVETQEHWVHEACAVWTSGVYLVAGKLYGVHEAIQMAASGLCPRCHKPGATVGCSHKGCAQTYHYTCATEAGCLLNEENFSLKCPKHKRHLV